MVLAPLAPVVLTAAPIQLPVHLARPTPFPLAVPRPAHPALRERLAYPGLLSALALVRPVNI